MRLGLHGLFVLLARHINVAIMERQERAAMTDADQRGQSGCGAQQAVKAPDHPRKHDLRLFTSKAANRLKR